MHIYVRCVITWVSVTATWAMRLHDVIGRAAAAVNTVDLSLFCIVSTLYILTRLLLVVIVLMCESSYCCSVS